MNLSELIDYMAEHATLDPKQALHALEAFWDAVIKALQKGEAVTLKNIGQFGSKVISARCYFDFKTRQNRMFPARTKLYFKASTNFTYCLKF